MAAGPSAVEAKGVLRDILEALAECEFFDTGAEQPIVRFLHPAELQREFSAQLGENGANQEEIHQIVRQIVQYSVRTFSPHFHNQLFAGIDVYGLAGAWLTEALNTSQYTYEVAPVFTLLEREVLAQSLALVGYPPMPEADGIVSPGGSLSNMYGIVLARYHYFPEVKSKGLNGLPTLGLLTSEDGHYSITKGAHWLGIGTDNIFKVRSDELGRMDVNDLKSKIVEARKRGCVPFFVNATAGTTVLGAFDPLEEIAAICREENIWLHVDACLGGTLLLSNNYRNRLAGIEQSNSVSWNPHKMLGAPFQCSFFLVKGKNALHEANCAGAKYLFQQDKFYDVSWDTGDKSVQCGRKTDALKLWLMWKARGTAGLRHSVDVAMEAAEYFFQLVKNRPGFRMVLPKYQGSNICFWYIPPKMRGKLENEEWHKKLHKIAPDIKERMIMKGTLMIGYTPMVHKGYENFFRMVVNCQPPPTHENMNYVIEQIEHFGEDLGGD
ncbi:PREDICTED: cysteine sulfinic acid decarboxylase-like [Ceratosolen solmsi marchali]|uniref:Cysteine sulfinic acid decarboxylase-like n=1 Tax=Ceratosolen solmsi marchali TaxID=326594 RepID=A0AAJ7DV03_9HYME|nr:PREDICTED: cysteine sulfinic acid decarboxylase-like [Ceratosolen solmsi marchali]